MNTSFSKSANSVSLLEQAKWQLDCLHFQTASFMLDEIPESDRGFDWLIAASRSARGLYKSKKALKWAKDAFDLSMGDDGDIASACLALAKAEFACGHGKKAEEILEAALEQSLTPSIALAAAGLYAEIGQVEASSILLSSLDPSRFSNPLEQMDDMVLKADVSSFRQDIDEAFYWYQKALDDCDALIPKNWVHLRKMLIYQSMADTCEQIENYPAAFYYYVQGMKELEEQEETDPDVTDSSGYQIEFLLSYANCCGNDDSFEQAHELLDQARDILELDPPLQSDYFSARYLYIKGLLAMNEGKDDLAIDCLEKAVDLQEILLDKGLEKPEHLARARYYLGRLLPDTRLVEKVHLYTKVLPVFRTMQAKDPAFYDLASAELQNEFGRLMMDQEPDLAVFSFECAIDGFNRLLRSNPDDLLALESLIVARANLLMVDTDDRLDEEEQLKKDLQKAADQKDFAFLSSIESAIKGLKGLDPNTRSWLDSFFVNFEKQFDA